MADLEEVQHDITLIIATSLFILFATGLAGAGTVNGAPVVIPA